MPKTEEENIGTRSSHAESEPILLIQPFTVTPARTEQWQKGARPPMSAVKRRSFEHLSMWIAAVGVGVAATYYARLIGFAQNWYFHFFRASPMIIALLSPILFLVAVGLVHQIAPQAKGSGIPQVLEALEIASTGPTDDAAWKSDLVSMKTAIIKVLSSTFGILAGASIGREGPTVQIASSVFARVGREVKLWNSGVTLQPYLTAGAAAGVAAAFNTPIAGIAFALEEISDGAFAGFRQPVMIAVILSGICAQALQGDYLYFGHPLFEKPEVYVLPQALLLGLISGTAGGVFAKLLSTPGLTRLPKHWVPRALICGILCAAIGYATHGDTAGSGYEITREVLSKSNADDVSLGFPLWKLSTTVLSYLSGMAGGIFSPSLSIGAGIGATVAQLAHFSNFKACMLMGMVAFFSAAVQAPLTAVIIVTEMTDEHILILPFMVAALIGNLIGKWIMPVPLYHFLAKRHVGA